jgi:hypothetical protein
MHHKSGVRFVLVIEGETMAQVSGNYTFTITPASTNALAINPPSESETLQVGETLSGVLATVSGGQPPYNYDITGVPPGSGITFNEVPSADGVTGDADIQIGGSPNAADLAATPEIVTIAVTDSAGSTASLKRPLTK